MVMHRWARNRPVLTATSKKDRGRVGTDLTAKAMNSYDGQRRGIERDAWSGPAKAMIELNGLAPA